MGAWLEKYSVDCNGRSLLGPAGGGEVNVFPEIRTEHTKIYICVSTMVCWVLVMCGGGSLSLWELLAGDSALLGRTGSVGGSSPHFPGV